MISYNNLVLVIAMPAEVPNKVLAAGILHHDQVQETIIEVGVLAHSQWG